MSHGNNRFVLVRGLLREARHWGKFVDILQNKFPQGEIFTPDILGSGSLHHMTSPDTIAELTEGLREQVPTGEKLNLIAISMGGMIAIDWMIRYPKEIKSAVLINTSVRNFSPFYLRLRWQKYPAILRMICHSKSRQEQDILYLTSNQHRQNNDLLESWQLWQQQYPVSKRSARNQIIAAAKFMVSGKPDQPILIITSKGDQLVDYGCSYELQQNWQTDIQQHDTAGHDLPLDEPDWLADVIVQWFKKSLTELQ